MLLANPDSITTRMRSEAETLANAGREAAVLIGAELKSIKFMCVKRANEGAGT